MDIKSMYLAEIEQWMKEHGQPAFRAKQVFQWMHQKYVASTEDMSNLPNRWTRKDSCTLRQR